MANFVHSSDALDRALMVLQFKKKPRSRFGNPTLRPQDLVPEQDRSGLQRVHIVRPHSQISKALSLKNQLF